MQNIISSYHILLVNFSKNKVNPVFALDIFCFVLYYEEKQMILENEFHIPMTQQFKEEISNMCNLSQEMKDKGNKVQIDIVYFQS